MPFLTRDPEGVPPHATMVGDAAITATHRVVLVLDRAG